MRKILLTLVAVMAFGAVGFAAIKTVQVQTADVPEPQTAAVQEQKQKPTSRPMAKGELRNEICVVSGTEKSSPEFFVEYKDAKAGVFARIHTCCADCKETLATSTKSKLKAAYETAYLQVPGGKAVEYGKPRLELKNEVCPISGEPVDATGKMFVNYNGSAVLMCCPSCQTEFLKSPDKYLHNINDAIDTAVKAEKLKNKKKVDGDK